MRRSVINSSLLAAWFPTQRKCGVFPFGFRRKAVNRQQDTVFLTYGAFATGTAIGQVFANSTFVLAHEVSLRVEVIFVLLIGRVFQNTALDENHLVDAVGTPFAIFIGLKPVDTDHGVVVVSRVAEVVLYQRLVVSQFFPPYQRIGQCATPDFRISSSPGVFYPVEVFAVVRYWLLPFRPCRT
jgi:hypothetical protein